jgi:uncharacterized membrane protein
MEKIILFAVGLIIVFCNKLIWRMLASWENDVMGFRSEPNKWMYRIFIIIFGLFFISISMLRE